eukprot:scaffold18142_cov123-Amphora_coffeaeformis.AAC.1
MGSPQDSVVTVAFLGTSPEYYFNFIFLTKAATYGRGSSSAYPGKGLVEMDQHAIESIGKARS